MSIDQIKDAGGKVQEKTGESTSIDERQAKGVEKPVEGTEKEKIEDDLDELNP
ncbi:MAG: hypothetical protein JWQ21_899 [Herminiimonas sp.]|nr:hypothetical protein [Herminiimonas sp.]